MIIVGSNLDIIDTPNFQLFYEIVGSSAITANSQQVATELFGEQPDQHQSEIINLPSAMTSDDMYCLKLFTILQKITRYIVIVYLRQRLTMLF